MSLREAISNYLILIPHFLIDTEPKGEIYPRQLRNIVRGLKSFIFHCKDDEYTSAILKIDANLEKRKIDLEEWCFLSLGECVALINRKKLLDSKECNNNGDEEDDGDDCDSYFR
ncbi:MAG: hypothetical protein MASP_01804 [Candidatus Methanolliviera sp. GoM_asphalt]|nr:MAG: hypothetical protein MASP_01804 [Candidatus Methanolliviera sp. GoM_asphalt]